MANMLSLLLFAIILVSDERRLRVSNLKDLVTTNISSVICFGGHS